jgi:hypothetical protein
MLKNKNLKYDTTSPLRFDSHSLTGPAAAALPLFSCNIISPVSRAATLKY